MVWMLFVLMALVLIALLAAIFTIAGQPMRYDADLPEDEWDWVAAFRADPAPPAAWTDELPLSHRPDPEPEPEPEREPEPEPEHRVLDLRTERWEPLVPAGFN